MNKLGIIILTSLWGLFLFGCGDEQNTNQEKEVLVDGWDSIKYSKNHLDYLYYITMNSESNHFDSAVTKYFKYEEEYYDTVGRRLWTCTNDCISIIVYGTDSVMLEHEPLAIADLREKSLLYLLNSGDKEEMPSKRNVKDYLGQSRTVSNGFFYVAILPNSLSGLQQCIIEIKKSIKDYKNKLCKEWYNIEYFELEPEIKKAVDSIFKIGFRLGTYIFVDPELDIVEDESEVD